jgi:2-hydroxyglutarate dehydrogenase
MTAIFDSHAYLQHLEGEITSSGKGHILLESTVTDILHAPSSNSHPYNVKITQQSTTNRKSKIQDNEEMTISARTVVNAGGLWADHVAKLLHGSSIHVLPRTWFEEEARIYPCKGTYYTFPNRRSDDASQRLPLVSRLIYPIPDPNLTGLGIHCTVDLAGRLRLGPDAEYVELRDDYGVEEGSEREMERRKRFYTAVSRYLRLPSNQDNLSKFAIDYAGLRLVGNVDYSMNKYRKH